jgi:hypothetical protein
MSHLLKNPQGISLLIVCVVYLCHIIWSVEAVTDMYFFERDIESRQLRLTYHNTSDMCNDNEDIACLKPQAFLFNLFPTHSIFPVYQVLEYEDYLNQRKSILSETKNNINFTVFDSRTQTWYLVFKGDIKHKPLEQASDELKDVQLSILYYTDVFSDIPSPNEIILVIALLTMIFIAATTFISFVSMIRYMREPNKNMYERSLHNRYLPWFLWMFSSSVFPITIIIGLSMTNKMDGCYIALISTMADWGSSGFIIWIIMREAGIIPSKLDISNEHRRLNLCFILELVLLLVPTLTPAIIYAFDRTIFGPDDASRLTGYFYINTMMASINEIKIM